MMGEQKYHFQLPLTVIGLHQGARVSARLSGVKYRMRLNYIATIKNRIKQHLFVSFPVIKRHSWSESVARI
jgi:hypothetical protein